MPRKPKKAPVSGLDEASLKSKGKASKYSDDDDTASIGSSGGESVGSLGSLASTDDDVDHKMEDLIERLSEKRASTRIEAMKSLRKTLSHHYVKHAVEHREDTISTYLMASLRKGTTEEIVLACTNLTLLGITLGVDANKMYQTVHEGLIEFARNHTKSATSRAAALETVAFLCFIASNEDSDTHKLLEVCQTVFTQTQVTEDSFPVVVQAISSWALLATTLPRSLLSGPLMHNVMPQLTALLDCDQLEVRSAAGETIALIYSAFEETQYEDEDEVDTNAPASISASSTATQLLATPPPTPPITPHMFPPHTPTLASLHAGHLSSAFLPPAALSTVSHVPAAASSSSSSAVGSPSALSSPTVAVTPKVSSLMANHSASTFELTPQATAAPATPTHRAHVHSHSHSSADQAPAVESKAHSTPSRGSGSFKRRLDASSSSAAPASSTTATTTAQSPAKIPVNLHVNAGDIDGAEASIHVDGDPQHVDGQSMGPASPALPPSSTSGPAEPAADDESESAASQKKRSNKKKQRRRFDSNADPAAQHEDMEEKKVSIGGVGFEELLDKLGALSTDSDRRKGKKEKREQRSAFRDIIATVEDGVQPSETLTIGRGKVKHTFYGWEERLRLEVLRKALGSGLPRHFEVNELLSDIFGVNLQSSSAGLGLTRDEIRAQRDEHIFQSKVKAREQYEHNVKQRKKKSAHVHEYDHDDS